VYFSIRHLHCESISGRLVNFHDCCEVTPYTIFFFGVLIVTSETQTVKKFRMYAPNHELEMQIR
jgi:hypothetical protein